MKTFKKIVSSTLIVIMVLTSWRPALVLAQEAEVSSETTTTEVLPTQEQNSTPTSESSPEPVIENNTSVTDEVASGSVTGENTIEVLPSPTATPEEEVTGSLEEGPLEVLPPEEETLEETTEETSTEETPEEPSASIGTGDAVTLTEVENSINTTEVNSQSIFQTLNIYVNEESDIDLSITPLKIAETVFVVDQRTDEVVNVQVFDIGNFAYLSNDIVSNANTGGNSIEGGAGTINTGNAYSIVSLLNKVNTTIIDSTIHFVTINIFGNLDGNIVLPEFAPSDVRSCCTNIGTIENNAVVNNTVNSTAVSGQNSITTTEGGEAEINTGEAGSVVNVVNLVNTNLINVVFRGLYINTLGQWFGEFLGWFGFDGLNGGISYSPIGEGDDCEGCQSDIESLNNFAYVSNNVTSSANSGGNSLEGGGNIQTGNAYSSVNILNLINSSIIGSWGFLGFINIFGTLTGDIGGESAFTPPPIETQSLSSPSEFVRESGGLLNVDYRHNVGNYVFPGDTVTFFVDVKNPGTGIVYGTKLSIELIRNGITVGGAFFDLGDIKAHKGVKLTTGLVLARGTPPGTYTTRVTAWGLVGPGDNEISDSENSSFLVAGFTPFSSGGGIVEDAEAASTLSSSDVMGTTTTNSFAKEKIFMMIFILLFTIYISGRSYQKRREIAAFLRKNGRVVGPAAAAVLRGLILRIGIFL